MFLLKTKFSYSLFFKKFLQKHFFLWEVLFFKQNVIKSPKQTSIKKKKQKIMNLSSLFNHKQKKRTINFKKSI
jgi:hypothetical protein